jgi:bifunctional non-homologous end joining protein LigD
MHRTANADPAIVHYYERIAALILPFLRDRPLVLREPGRRRFTRQAPANTPDYVQAAGVTSPDTGKTVDYLLAQDRRSLLWLARRGHVELHAWHSRLPSLAFPDYAFFDLDPSPSTSFEQVCEVALLVKAEMDRLGLRSCVKTSGVSGLQVYVPARPDHPFGQVRAWTGEVCERIHRAHPRLTTMEWTVEERRGVFLDHRMMAPNKNSIVALSARGTPGATVSMPLSWDELAAAPDPAGFTIELPLERLRRASRLFRPVVKAGQRLPLGKPRRERAHTAGPDWRRAGRRLRLRCVVGGWAPPEGERGAHMGYVLLGLYYLGELAYVGKAPVPPGRRHELYVKVAEQAAPGPPFITLPRSLPGARWARPELVCSIECSGLTGGPDLRAPTYLGLEPGTDPRAYTLEQLGK